MATVNLACTKAEWWSYSSNSWINEAIGAGPIRIGYIPSVGIPSGVQLFSFAALPQNITITSAIAHFKAYDSISAAGGVALRSRVSGNYRAWTNTAPDDLLTSAITTYTSAFEYTIDITDQLKTYVTQGNAPYLYKFHPYDQGAMLYDYLTGGNAPYIALTFEYNYTACGAPTNVLLPATIAEIDPVLSWSGAAPGKNNPIVSYEIQYAQSSDNVAWGGWAALKTVASTATSGSTTVALPTTRGGYRKYRIRTRGGAGADWYSPWKETPSVRKNQVPGTPTIGHPTAGKITANNRPRFLVTLGAEPDNQLMTLAADGYTPSSAGPYASGKKLILRRTANAAAGDVPLTISATDNLGASSGAATQSIIHTPATWTEAVTAGTTRIKAAHMAEIREAANQARIYYGLAAYSWAEPIIAQQTSMGGWAGHVAEIRAAIDEVVALINGWDVAATANKVMLPDWSAIRGKQPQADVMVQLRTVVTTL